MAKESVPMHARPLVYIAGPYTRPDPVENTHNVCLTADDLLRTGLCSVLAPHLTLLYHLVSPKPVEAWYELDLAHLARCDVLYRMPGDSTGADDEVEFAKARGIPVFTEWSALIAWLVGKR